MPKTPNTVDARGQLRMTDEEFERLKPNYFSDEQYEKFFGIYLTLCRTDIKEVSPNLRRSVRLFRESRGRDEDISEDLRTIARIISSPLDQVASAFAWADELFRYFDEAERSGRLVGTIWEMPNRRREAKETKYVQ